jgi:hypothetical protein
MIQPDSLQPKKFNFAICPILLQQYVISIPQKSNKLKNFPESIPVPGRFPDALRNPEIMEFST